MKTYTTKETLIGAAQILCIMVYVLAGLNLWADRAMPDTDKVEVAEVKR